MRRNLALVAVIASLLVVPAIADAAPPVCFGAESLLPDDERSHYSRSVNFAPADAQVCDLNPPRFRWRYHPSQPGAGGDYLFTFQVARDEQFKDLLVNVQTLFNFHNTLAPLPGKGPFYWRIGYRDQLDPDAPFEWSRVRKFTIAPDAQVWDRSSLARPDFANKPHPRILLNEAALPRLHKLVHTDKEARAIFERIRTAADEAVASDWWNAMPESDRDPADRSYLGMAQDLVHVAFCWRVTGDAKYAGVKERALRFARYPKGGRSSPQGAGGDSAEDSTQTTEFLALLYDWLYPDLTAAERKEFAASLDWRIEHFVNHFAWRYTPGPRRSSASAPASRPATTRPVVFYGSLSTMAGSHQFEGFWDTFPAALAAYEDSENARLCFELGVNYMVGVGAGHGPDEGWNEGPGYGNSKLAWLVNSMLYLDSVFPEFQLGRNPWIRRQGEWFRAVTPVGLKHAPWGHGSNNAEYIENGHRKSYRKLAYLTGDGRFLANWRQYGSFDDPRYDIMRPWIECALPLWREAPSPVVAEDPVRLFPLAGWVTALSGSPSDPDTYRKGIGMVFACRPDGAYSHAFACDNSFHIFAYGQDISHAAGTGEKEPYAYHTMSHNAILVDGLGQTQGRQSVPRFGRLLAFGHKDGVVYWCGDATLSYPRIKHRVRTYWGEIGEVYDQRDLAHVTRVNRHVLFVRNKYFVILDDLAAEEPAQWTWLYHARDSKQADLDREKGAFRYRIGDVDVHVVHLRGRPQLDVEDRLGLEGLVNPLTGEDYRQAIEKIPAAERIVARHNLWVTTRDKQRAWRFLTVIYPVRPGAPAPRIEGLDDLTLSVQAGKNVDVISFDARTAHPANILVDLAAVAPTGLHEPARPQP